MCGSRGLHHNDGDGGGESAGKPTEFVEPLWGVKKAEQFGDANADEGAEEVTTDKCARLREGCLDRAVDKYGGCTLKVGQKMSGSSRRSNHC